MHLTTVNRVDPVVGASPMLAHKEMPVGLRNRRVCVYIDFEPYNPNKSYKERKMFLLYLSLEYIEHNLCGAHKEHSLRAFLYQASGNANLTKVNNKSPYQYWGIKRASKFPCKQLKEKCDCAI